MSIQQLIETILKSNRSSITLGGNKITSNGTSFFELLLIFLVVLLIKGFIVYVLYNNLMPQIIASFSGKDINKVMEDFRELNYMESILLVILLNTLFSN